MSIPILKGETEMLTYTVNRIKQGKVIITVSYGEDSLYFTGLLTSKIREALSIYWYTDSVSGSFESVSYREFVEFCKSLKNMLGMEIGIEN